MNVLINSSSSIWTTTFTPGSKTLLIIGNNNIPMDIDSLVSLYDVTQNAAFNFVGMQFTWFRSNNLPIYCWIFNVLPAGASGADTLNMLIAIPQNQAEFVLQQKQASAPAGTVGTLVANETPSGTINGTNKVFTLVNTPSAGTLVLLLTPSGGNVALQTTYPAVSGQVGTYTLVGNTITFVVAPPTGSSISALYYH